MKPQPIRTIIDHLNIIWAIASKDILDALRNKVVVSMIVMLSLVLLMPKMLPLMFEEPQMALPIYDRGNASLVAILASVPEVVVQKMKSEQELSTALCNAAFPEIGLLLPAGFDQQIAERDKVDLQGYVCWGKRHQVAELKPKLEAVLTRAVGKPVILHVEGNTVYPVAEGSLFLGLATVNSVVMILMMGIFLVPSLLFEEKETRTLQALLVSPASISQVVIGKALAGFFYILVTGGVIFAISWAEVIHWEMVILFVIGGGVFSVAMGLILGSFFEKQQDVIGGEAVLLLFLVGAVLVKALGLELPAFVETLLPWIPSVALAEFCHLAFSEVIPAAQVWGNLWIILFISLPLYALIIWKVRRFDR